MESLTKIPVSYFVHVDKLILQFSHKSKEKIWNSQNNIEEELTCGMMLSDFKTFHTATVIKTVILAK